MIPARAFNGRKVAVFGLGRTGLAAARALAAGGAEVLAWDDNAETRARAEEQGVALHDLDKAHWGRIKALVLSPGVPLTHPAPHRFVEAALKHDAPVIGDVELFAQEIAREEGVTVVGVTGTNGKSTTTALLGHVLRLAGRDVRVGGNIGEAVLNLEPPRPGAVYVLELSSFQLDLSYTLRCQVGVFLNLTEDHLDRHGDMESYLAAKMRIFDNQDFADAAVVGVDDHWTQGVCTRLCAARGRKVIPVSARTSLGRGVYVVGGVIYEAGGPHVRAIADLADAPGLPGRHNAQNVAAAAAAALRLGLSAADVEQGLTTFPGLAHRQERVARIGKVSFVNDSKATNADAAAQAMGCYDDIFWIAGGQAKSGGVSSLSAFFPRVRKAYLIGQDAELLRGQIAGAAEVEMSGDLQTALESAARDAARSEAPQPVVLLSPACASFDQFRHFEHRGDVFRDAACKLADAAQKTGDAA